MIFDPINLLTHSQELALGCEPFAAALPSLTHTDSDQAKQTLGYDPALFTCKMGGGNLLHDILVSLKIHPVCVKGNVH